MGRKRGGKQTYIAGTEPPQIPEINEAAEEYRDVRDRRMALTTEEVEAADTLLELMRKHELTEYEYDGTVVTRAVGPEKVKVKKKTNGDGENGEEAGDED